MALLQAGLAAGTSLISGIFANRAASKASREQFRQQSLMNEATFNQQRHLDTEQFQRQQALQREANDAQSAFQRAAYIHNHDLNDRIGAFNADILANHSTSTTRGGIDFSRLVRESEAAGFNPLTVLRMGGAAGYSVSEYRPARDLMSFVAPGEIPTAHIGQAYSGQAASGQAHAVQYGNPVGDALTAGLAAFQANSPAAKEREFLELGIARAQIANLNSDTAANNRRMFTPTWTAPTTVRAGGFGGEAKAGGPSGLSPAGYDAENGKITSAYPFGLKPAGWVADVASWAERLGEPAEWLAFPFVATADAGSVTRQLVDRATDGGGTAAAKAVNSAASDATAWYSGHLRNAYAALTSAWNSPAWNAK